MAETRLWTVSDQQPVQLRWPSPRSTPASVTWPATPSWCRVDGEAAEDGAHLVVFPEMTLTGYPAEDLVLRESFARASEHAVVDLAASLAEQGLGDVAVVVGYLAHTEGSGPAPVDHPPVDDADRPGDANPRGAPERGRPALRRRGRRPLLQAAPAQLRRLRRGAVLRARLRAADRPAARDRRGADHLRGPLGGGRPVRVAGRRASTSSSPPTPRPTSGPRTTCGCPWSAVARPRRTRRSSTATRSAARTSWSSTATRSSSPRTASCSPAPRSSSST